MMCMLVLFRLGVLIFMGRCGKPSRVGVRLHEPWPGVLFLCIRWITPPLFPLIWLFGKEPLHGGAFPLHFRSVGCHLSAQHPNARTLDIGWERGRGNRWVKERHYDKETTAVGRTQKQMGIPNFGLLAFSSSAHVVGWGLDGWIG